MVLSHKCISGAKGVYSVDVLEGAPMTLAEFKAYADVRAPFPSSTADAGSITSAAGVRRGRSSSTPILSSLQEPQGNPATKTGKDWAVHRHGGGGRGGEGGEVERRVRMFWKSLGPNVEPPMYGADTLGTLFHPDDHDAWNVGRLDTILQLLKGNLPGITSPMLYAGMWRSMFAFHVEDVNLYSINYLHRGDPKSWYCIPPRENKRYLSPPEVYTPQCQ
ncbi:unnamed protein product [Choristocarpus tenellus]